MHLHDLAPKRLVHLVHGRFKTRRPSLGEKLVAWKMSLHFNDLVFSRIVLFDTQKHLAGLNVAVVGQQLVQLRLDKLQEPRIGIKMNGMDLNLH